MKHVSSITCIDVFWCMAYIDVHVTDQLPCCYLWLNVLSVCITLESLFLSM